MEDTLTEIKGGDATAEKLRKADFTTIVALAVTPIREIMERTGHACTRTRTIQLGGR